MQRFQREGTVALATKPTPGRPPKLSGQQEKALLSWAAKLPTAFVYAGELWTSKSLAALINKQLGVIMNSNYLVAWFTQRKQSAQKLARRALERDKAAIARWVAGDWPRIQKKPKWNAPTLS